MQGVGCGAQDAGCGASGVGRGYSLRVEAVGAIRLDTPLLEATFVHPLLAALA